MTPFVQTLVAIMFGMIAREVPAIRQDPEGERARAYRADIAKMAEIDEQVAAPGKLVNPRVDQVLLAAVRFYEARFRSAPADGDCSYVTPSLSYEQRVRHAGPKGLVPAWMVQPRRVCPAIGPMQISSGNRFLAPSFAEVRELFHKVRPWDVLVGQGHDPWTVGRVERLSVEDLRDPLTNVRLGYALLWHWKVAADLGLPARETRATPPGVWLTAWGWGKLPGPHPRTVRYVDREGRQRCALATRLLAQLAEAAHAEGSGFRFEVPEGWYCGHEPGALSYPET